MTFLDAQRLILGLSGVSIRFNGDIEGGCLFRYTQISTLKKGVFGGEEREQQQQRAISTKEMEKKEAGREERNPTKPGGVNVTTIKEIKKKKNRDTRKKAYRRRRTGAALGVFDVCAGALGQLLEQKGPFYSQLLDLALYAGQPEPGGVVGILNLVCAVLELDTLPSVGFFDRRRQRRGHAGWLNVSLGDQFSLGRHCWRLSNGESSRFRGGFKSFCREKMGKGCEATQRGAV